MKDFYEVLKDNGIKIPWFFKKEFLQTWGPAAERYNNLVKNWEEQKELWEVKRQYILKNWGKKIPKLPDLRIEFRNPTEAIQEIAAYECVHVFKFLDMMEQTHRKEWLSKIIEQAPEGCRKIIVYTGLSSEALYALKGFRRSKISGLQGETIEETYKNGLGEVRMNGLGVQGIAFDPKKPPSVEFWLMTPHNATVEYL